MASFNGSTSSSELNWFHHGITPKQAEELLSAKQSGSFLVRECKSPSGAYALCIASEGKVINYLILSYGNVGMISFNVRDKSGTDIVEMKFTDIQELVNEFMKLGTNNDYTPPLLYPVPAHHEIESGFQDTGKSSTPSSPGIQSIPNVVVVKGDISTFTQADVLVNLITKISTKLSDSGAVAKSFLKAGEGKLQQVFELAGCPRDFGKDVVATDAVDGIHAKRIYHTMIKKYQDAQSIQLLSDLIRCCLRKAEEEKMTSIAFPTVGCGDLKYDYKDVIKCFSEAGQGCALKIYVVAFTQELNDKFAEAFPAKQPDQVYEEPMPVSPKDDQPRICKPKPRRIRSNEGISKDIVVEIYHSGVESLSDEIIDRIRSVPTKIKKQAEVTVDVLKSGISFRGKNDALINEVMQRVLKLLVEDELLQSELSYIKKTKGVKAYLKALFQKTDMKYSIPHYWTCRDLDSIEVEGKRYELFKGTAVYDAVESVFLGTSALDLLGKGVDARGVQYSSVIVRKIWVIENPQLYRSYQFKLKNFAWKAHSMPFDAVFGIDTVAEIKTRLVTDAHFITDQLVSEVNEVYLFHGTSHIKEIEKTGIDSRFSGEYGELFGKGAYFAESSTKSDQYADRKKDRVPNGTPIYMFLARVLLGQPFISQKAMPDIRRAPCSDVNCQERDKCSSNHRMCDSVIGTRRFANTSLLFREFIVYDHEQSYPEFLIEYERQ